MSTVDHAGLNGLVQDLSPDFLRLADEIWDYAELAFEETRSAEAQASLLEKHGFAVARGVAGLATAFTATWGQTGPVIGILGEFDALPGLSQAAGVLSAQPLAAGGPGHGCGHNLLGVGGMLAAVALARHLEASGLVGTIRYFGCPAEEAGHGKVHMVRAGVFDGVDAVLGWHPGSFNGVRARSTLALVERIYRFTGRAAHAAMAPHLGRSALDGLELMNIGVNFLREHMLPEARVHYAITDAGGVAPNVVQARAEALYLIRAPHRDGAAELAARVDNIARGAALMSETQVEIVERSALDNTLPNSVLLGIMHRAMERLGEVPFTPEDHAFAAAIGETLPKEVRRAQRLGNGTPPLMTTLKPYDGTIAQGTGSTDVGAVSWLAPTVECATATWAAGTPSHSWQVVSQGKSSAAKTATIHAARTIAGTGLDLLSDPALLRVAQDEHRARIAN